MLLSAGGCNYHEWVVGRSANGGLRLVDVYIYFSAEWITQQFRRAFLQVAAHHNRSILQKLTGAESDFIKHMPQLAQMATHIRNRQSQEAMNIYKALPQSLHDDKLFLMLRLQASQQIGDDEYLTAFDAMRRKFPEDPCIDLLAIDGYTIREQYEKAFESIDRLDKSIGGDPYLEVLRANNLVVRKRNADAIACCRRAIASEATLWDAHALLVQLLAAEVDHQGLATAFDAFETTFQEDPVETFKELDLAAFVASPEGKAWSKARRDRESQ